MSITLLFLLTFLPHMAFAGARVTLSLFALHLGATPFTVGIIISLIAVSFVLGLGLGGTQPIIMAML